MTLIAGIVCADGLVVCGDTQITLSSSKASRGKLFLTDPNLKDCRSVMAASGDYELCKVAIQRTEPVFRFGEDTPDLAEMQDALEASMASVYSEHVFPHPLYATHPRDFTILAAFWRRDEGYRLFKTSDAAVYRVDRYEASGTGADLAEYILKRLYRDEMTTAEAVSLAIHMMSEVKERGLGVGGDTQIAVLDSEGVVAYADESHVEEFEEANRNLEALWKLAFEACFNVDITEHQYRLHVNVIARGLRCLRGPTVRSEAIRRANPDLTEDEHRKLFKRSTPRLVLRSKRDQKDPPPSPESPGGSDAP